MGYPKIIITKKGEKGVVIHTHKGYRVLIVYDKKGKRIKKIQWSEWFKEYR